MHAWVVWGLKRWVCFQSCHFNTSSLSPPFPSSLKRSLSIAFNFIFQRNDNFFVLVFLLFTHSSADEVDDGDVMTLTQYAEDLFNFMNAIPIISPVTANRLCMLEAVCEEIISALREIVCAPVVGILLARGFHFKIKIGMSGSTRFCL